MTTGRFTLPVALLTALLCWVLPGFLLPDVNLLEQSSAIIFPPNATDYNLWKTWDIPSLPGWLAGMAAFLLCVLTGWILIVLNNTFALIRIRASIQTSFYVLLIAACPLLHALSAGDVVAIFLLVALYFLFQSYQHPYPMASLFYAFVFLALGSLILPQLFFLAPLFWIGAYRFQALTLRSFCASLVGWSLPYWFLFGHAYFYGEMEIFYLPFKELVTFMPLFSGGDPWMLAALGYVGLQFLVCGIHCLATAHEDKLRTRAYLQFMIIFCFCLLTYIILQPASGRQMLPSLFIGVSILASHYFVLTSSRFSNFFFVFTLIGWAVLLGFNLWTLL